MPYFFISLFMISLSFGAQASTSHDYENFWTHVGDDVHIRSAFMPATGEKNSKFRQVVIFIPGRTSCFENNINLAERLTDTGVDFWSLDSRAHGLSEGRLENPEGGHDQRCHIDSFETYLGDIHHVIDHTILPYYNQEYVDFTLIGCSMGGNLVLRYLQEHEEEEIPLIRFKQAILLSPMVKFFTPGFPEPLARLLAFGATHLGYGEQYIPGHGERDLDESFDIALSTVSSHNAEDWDEQQAFYQRHPNMITAGATYSWIKAAFESTDRLKEMNSCSTPLIGFLAGDDTHVDYRAASDLLWRLRKTKGTRYTVYRNAFHVLTREDDEFIPDFWKDLLRLFKDCPFNTEEA